MNKSSQWRHLHQALGQDGRHARRHGRGRHRHGHHEGRGQPRSQDQPQGSGSSDREHAWRQRHQTRGCGHCHEWCHNSGKYVYLTLWRHFCAQNSVSPADNAINSLNLN